MTFKDFVDQIKDGANSSGFRLLGRLYIVESVEYGTSNRTGLSFERVKVMLVNDINETNPDLDTNYKFWLPYHMWEYCSK